LASNAHGRVGQFIPPRAPHTRQAKADGTLDSAVASMEQQRADYSQLEAAGVIPPQYTFQKAVEACRAGQFGPELKRQQEARDHQAALQRWNLLQLQPQGEQQQP